MYIQPVDSFVEVQPLVSVCIPMYNGATHLHACIESIINQDYKNLEILICDDGSNDDSVAIIKAYATKDQRIKLIINEKNLGLVGNWEACINNAKSEWIKFMFQDDTMEPHCVSTMMQNIFKHQSAIAICSRNFMFEANIADADKIDFEKHILKTEDVLKEGKNNPETIIDILTPFVTTNFLGEPICTLFSKSYYTYLGGYNKQMKQIVDYEFSLKAIVNTKFSFIAAPLVNFRIHANATTQTNKNDSLYKSIVSEECDKTHMLLQIKNNPLFAPLRKIWTDKLIQIFIQRLYYRAYKHKSKIITSQAFNDVFGDRALPINYKFSTLTYLRNKFAFNKLIKDYIIVSKTKNVKKEYDVE